MKRALALLRKWWGYAVGAAAIASGIAAWVTAGMWWPASVQDVEAAETRTVEKMEKQTAGLEQFTTGTREISLLAWISAVKTDLRALRLRYKRSPNHDLAVRIKEKEEELEKARGQLADLREYMKKFGRR